ncbi:hypothetical protein WJI42_003502 [Klebsiella aerogenes]|uniref:hypothetical protein n=1 Tax=Klebsiella aerogenes TaxID=548 RepID=UPI0005EF6A70|nr:hypothetical protein [Klebsiella aerogenes]KJP52588.1 hypothetical protein SR71_16270 [Klebsiella aerogenes]HBS5720652.1 hypothetical protein [Klebsiella aerogenes]HED4102747.1 hypothetical protein [Klebsiella aerogenes]
MFDAKYVQKFEEHAGQVNEAIAAINYLLSINPELMALNVKVKRISDAELLFVEREWESKSERKVGWSWRAIIGKKKKKIWRLALSILSGEQVCGMLFCTGSRHGINVNIRYLEGSPDNSHPLKKFVLDIAIQSAEQYAESINAKMITIQNPIQDVVGRYIGKGYEYNQQDRRRKNKGLEPVCKTLEKML